VETPEAEEQRQTDEDERLCKICFEEEYSAILYPCGHMLCETCGRQMVDCPICRTRVVDVVKVYS
jgi:hypothetical protein